MLTPDTILLGVRPPPLGEDADALCIDDYLREHLFNFVIERGVESRGFREASNALKRVDDAHDKVGLPRAPEKAEDRLTRDTRLVSGSLGYLGIEAIPRIKKKLSLHHIMGFSSGQSNYW